MIGCHCWACKAIKRHITVKSVEKPLIFSVAANDLHDIWLRLCLCWEMGGHDRAFESESKNNMGLNHILPRPHPSNIVSFRKLDRMKEHTAIKAISRGQSTLCSHN